MTDLTIPAPPTTEEEARAFVRWCETEIGTGFHPDTSGSEYVTFNRIGLHADCSKCGEPFVPADENDTIHLVRDDGQECGGEAEQPLSEWGNTVPMLTEEQAEAFDLALQHAFDLLPDIYATSMEIFEELHPELFTGG